MNKETQVFPPSGFGGKSEIRPTLLMYAGPLYKTVLVGKEKVADLCWENPVHVF